MKKYKQFYNMYHLPVREIYSRRPFKITAQIDDTLVKINRVTANIKHKLRLSYYEKT